MLPRFLSRSVDNTRLLPVRLFQTVLPCCQACWGSCPETIPVLAPHIHHATRETYSNQAVTARANVQHAGASWPAKPCDFPVQHAVHVTRHSIKVKSENNKPTWSVLFLMIKNPRFSTGKFFTTHRIFGGLNENRGFMVYGLWFLWSANHLKL